MLHPRVFMHAFFFPPPCRVTYATGVMSTQEQHFILRLLAAPGIVVHQNRPPGAMAELFRSISHVQTTAGRPGGLVGIRVPF